MVKFGILGTGWIATDVVPAATGPNCSFVAVGSRNLERAQAFASQHGTAETKAYGSYREVIEDKNVDAVYIALPTDQHKEWTLACAAAGKHVLCEKPVAPTVEDVKEMIDACAAANVQFMDATHWVHHPRTATFKNLLSELKSPPTNVAATFNWQQMDPNNIRLNPTLEILGSIGDLGWYCAVAAFVVYGEVPTSVVSHVRRTVAPRGDKSSNMEIPVIMGGHAICHYSNNRTAFLSFDFDLCETQYVQVSAFDTTITLKDFVWPHNLQKLETEVRKLVTFHTAGQAETFIDTLGEHNRAHFMFDNFSAQVKTGILNTEWPARTLAVHKTMAMINQQ
jgi:predicted dehydrogenase